MNYTKAYLIYCNENKNIATDISNDLKRIGIEFTHDTFNPSDHDYVRQQYLNSSAPIFLLVSDNFLKSENCMKNILELVEDSRLKGRIKTIILEGRHKIEGTNQYESVSTKFERLGDVVNYINHWSVQYQAIRTEMRHATDERKKELQPQLYLIQDISTNILGDFMRYLRGTNYISYKRLENDSFRQLFDEFGGKSAILLNEYRLLPAYIPAVEVLEVEEEIIEDIVEEAAEEKTNIVEEAIENTLESTNDIDDSINEEIEETEETDNSGDYIINGIPGISLLPSDNNDKEEVGDELEGEDYEDTEIPVGLSDDLFDDLAEELVSDEDTGGFVEEDVINEVFDDIKDLEGETSDTEKPENSLEELLEELTDDTLEENSVIKEEEEAEAQEDLDNLIDDLADDILEEDEDTKEVSDDAPALEGESVDEEIGDLMDSIAEDLVNEMDTVPLDEMVATGEKVEDADIESSGEELLEKSTMDIAEELAISGDIKGASALYRQLIENAPDDVDLRYAFSMMLLESNSDISVAKENLLVAKKLDNEDEDILFALGTICEREGDYATAKSYYERVILLDLEHEQAYYRLGALLANCFENQEFVASSYLQRAISLDEDYSEAYFEYAKLLRGYFGKSKKAVKYFKKAIKHDRHFAEAHLELADLLLANGKMDKALNHYESAIEINNRFQTEENDAKYSVQQVEPEALSNDIDNQNRKTVLITGATSGIGRATAEIFAKNGYRIIITGRRVERLSALQSILEADFKVEVLSLTFDVRDQNAAEAAINGLSDSWKMIDILVNNAGLAKGFAPINEGELWHWETMIDTNLKGLLYMTRLVSPLMVARKTGFIINIGSIAAKETYLNGNVYCATKAAVDVLTKGMRLDLHQHNIRVTGIHPGHVETEFALVRFDGDEERSKIYDDFQPLMASDVADTIYYVASRPAHVNIEDVVMWSTQQASATIIDRSGRD